MEDKIVVAKGSLEFNEQTIGYLISKIGSQIFVEVSFIKAGEKKDKEFVFNNTKSNDYKLEHPTAKISVNIDIKDVLCPVFKVDNMPFFGDISLCKNKSNEIVLIKSDKELLNLTKLGVADKDNNIKVDELISCFKNKQDCKSQIILSTIEKLKKGLFLEIGNTKLQKRDKTISNI